MTRQTQKNTDMNTNEARHSDIGQMRQNRFTVTAVVNHVRWFWLSSAAVDVYYICEIDDTQFTGGLFSSSMTAERLQLSSKMSSCSTRCSIIKGPPT